MNFLICPHCGDEVQENAYTLHITGQFNGKQLYPIGTCYVLQNRAREEKKEEIDNTPKLGEDCPLCSEPLDNGKTHGSWCK